MYLLVYFFFLLSFHILLIVEMRKLSSLKRMGKKWYLCFLVLSLYYKYLCPYLYTGMLVYLNFQPKIYMKTHYFLNFH